MALCPQCHGRKQVINLEVAQFEMTNCPVCNATGEIPDSELCPKCLGLKVSHTLLIFFDVAIYVILDCSGCQGTGLVRSN